MSDAPMTMPRYPGQTPELTSASGSPTEADTPPSRGRKLFANIAWTFLGLFALTFFTLAKLPDAKIKSWVESGISNVLSPRGITLTAEQSELSFLFGIQYVMKNVTLDFPPPQPPARIDEIRVSPAFLPMLAGKLGASIEIKSGKGSAVFTGAFRGGTVSGTLRADQFDVGSIALLKLITDVNGSAVVTGKADFSGSTEDWTTLDASVQLDLSKISIPSQSIQGFSIPALNMSQGQVDVVIDHGKGQIRSLKIGKHDSTTDDIKATITGDLVFGKSLQNSTCNLKANFSLSESLLKSFVLLDAILAQGKQPDGSYAYRLEGPLLSPNPIPAGAH